MTLWIFVSCTVVSAEGLSTAWGFTTSELDSSCLMILVKTVYAVYFTVDAQCCLVDTLKALLAV